MKENLDGYNWFHSCESTSTWRDGSRSECPDCSEAAGHGEAASAVPPDPLPPPNSPPEGAVREALRPFAEFGKALFTLRHTPHSGAWYGLHAGADKEVEITIEHFKAAIEALGEGSQEGGTP